VDDGRSFPLCDNRQLFIALASLIRAGRHEMALAILNNELGWLLMPAEKGIPNPETSAKRLDVRDYGIRTAWAGYLEMSRGS